MRVLGLNGGFDLASDTRYLRKDEGHDAAAALVVDGELVAAVEEERLDRIKHSNKLPVNAARACLDIAGLSVADIDVFAFCGSEAMSDRLIFERALDLRLADVPLDTKTLILEHMAFGGGLALPQDRLRFFDHHDCHAASTYFLSGFDTALVASIDGMGDNIAGRILNAAGGRWTVRQTIPVENSLGFFYLRAIRHLGFGMFEEYKVMGLAAYGDPARYAAEFAEFYDLLPDGAFRVFTPALARLTELMPPRASGAPIEQHHKDLAAALQQALEIIALHCLKAHARATGARHLCLAGGVAHNSLMVGKLLQSGCFDDVFVQPASNDAGCAIGSAFLAYFDRKLKRHFPARQRHSFLGRSLGSETEIEAALALWGDAIRVTAQHDAADSASADIADGKIIGWAQGRAEFGPRALGNRSILADPRHPDTRDRINRSIKKREDFRPLAPAVMLEHAGDFFEGAVDWSELPFMAAVVPVTTAARAKIPAAVHEDGTARVQTVAQDQSPDFWRVISCFHERTGVPVVLNTSFNCYAEPIVDDVHDAVACLLTSKLDRLYVGGFAVERRLPLEECIASFSLRLPANIVAKTTYRHASRFDPYRTDTLMEINGIRGQVAVRPGLLNALQEMPTLACIDQSIPPEHQAELAELWTHRWLDLAPADVFRTKRRLNI